MNWEDLSLTQADEVLEWVDPDWRERFREAPEPGSGGYSLLLWREALEFYQPDAATIHEALNR